jgi:hypothetical protein
MLRLDAYMSFRVNFAGFALLATLSVSAGAAEGGLDFKREIEPVLAEFCHDCHADGVDKGDLLLDHHKSDRERLADHKTWLAVWENLRARMMPPAKKDQPTPAQREKVMRWIERDVFLVDPEKPDPGRVTIRRLNRVEYEYTVRDLFGVEFEADEEFPPDDTGYGFDTIGDVLSISPLLLEKYLTAAEKIADAAIPLEHPRLPTLQIGGEMFKDPQDAGNSAQWMPFERKALYEHRETVSEPGRYLVRVEMSVRGSMEATIHSAVLRLKANGRDLAQEDLSWDARKAIYVSGETELKRGVNTLGLELLPGTAPEQGENPLRLAVRAVYVQGPLNSQSGKQSPIYRRVFVDGPPPDDQAGREVYARKILRHIASRAYRRPVDEPALDRLVKLAIDHDAEDGVMFEQGVARAVKAILSSPRFLFRAEIQTKPDDPGEVVALDEFALASRLSYFFWSSIPDETLFQLAERGGLRADLRNQIDRMIEDPKSQRFIRSFVGQWLQTRDVEAIAVDPRRIIRIRDSRQAYRVFNNNIRQAMRDETEMLFDYLLKEDRAVPELLTADYTFLNEALAKFYGIDGVRGSKMQRVVLPAESPRRGVLTHGSVLLVTSNPTRTSPVKRGLFILDNILGTPAPPPPPNAPLLEEVTAGRKGQIAMREAMEIHRANPACASCHARFDPLGLALENFNALGMWRDEEGGLPIAAGGQLITGETFGNAREMADVLANARRGDFYRCLIEKLMTYALGRGMEYYDTPTIDRISEGLEHDGGKMRTLFYLIAESAPFQMRRGDGNRLARLGR